MDLTKKYNNTFYGYLIFSIISIVSLSHPIFALVNTPPQGREWMFVIPSLSRELWKVFLHTALVSISANWSSEFTNGSLIVFFSKWSFIKWRSISTCFVLSCCTGLFAILTAAWLSQYKFIGSFTLSPRSLRILLIHNSSHTPCTMPRNSASALDLATTFCFLLLHVTKLPHTYVK